MANFKLTQTGEQIQADLDLLDKNSATQGQVLTADGTGGASWQDASVGTEVVANPNLSGSETALTGLEVSGTKYKVSAGGTKMYMHSITFIREGAPSDYFGSVTVHIINNIPTPYSNIDSIKFSEITASGVVFDGTKIGVVSKAYKQSNTNKVIGFYYRNVWNLTSSTYATGGGGSYFIANNWSGDTVQAL